MVPNLRSRPGSGPCWPGPWAPPHTDGYSIKLSSKNCPSSSLRQIGLSVRWPTADSLACATPRGGAHLESDQISHMHPIWLELARNFQCSQLFLTINNAGIPAIKPHMGQMMKRRGERQSRKKQKKKNARQTKKRGGKRQMGVDGAIIILSRLPIRWEIFLQMIDWLVMRGGSHPIAHDLNWIQLIKKKKKSLPEIPLLHNFSSLTD